MGRSIKNVMQHTRDSCVKDSGSAAYSCADVFTRCQSLTCDENAVEDEAAPPSNRAEDANPRNLAAHSTKDESSRLYFDSELSTPRTAKLERSTLDTIVI